MSVQNGWPSIPVDELPHVLLRAVAAAVHGITIGRGIDRAQAGLCQ